MLAYDVPFMIVIAGAVMFYGTTDLTEIIAIQQQQGLSTWGLTVMPLLLL